MRLPVAAALLALSTIKVRDGFSDAFTPLASRPRGKPCLLSRFERNEDSSPFANDGPFAWTVPYLRQIGYEEGKQTYYGAPSEIRDGSRVSAEEAQRRREAAKSDLTNISTEERRRRDELGDAFVVLTGEAVSFSRMHGDGLF